jgi:hypothetical protein
MLIVLELPEFYVIPKISISDYPFGCVPNFTYGVTKEVHPPPIDVCIGDARAFCDV